MKRVIFPVLILLTAGALFAEPMELSVTDAVSLGKANNLSLKIQDITTEQARREKAERWNAFLPDMSASATLSRSNVASTYSGTYIEGVIPNGGIGAPAYDTVIVQNFSEELDPWNLIGSFSAQLVLTPAISNGIKALDLNYRTEQLNSEKGEKELEHNIERYYYQLVQLEKSIELLEKNQATMAQRYEDMSAMYRNGLITELDLLQTESGLASLTPALTSLMNNYEQLKMAFCMDLGLPLGQELDLTDEIQIREIDELDADILIARYLADNLDVQSTILGKDSLENGRAATSNQRLPQLILGWNYSPMIMDPFNDESWEDEPFEDNDSGAFSITLNIPLDDWIPRSSADSDVREMDDSLKSMEYQEKLLYQATEMSIRQYAMGLEASRQNLEVLEENVILAQKAYDLSWDSYRNGQKTATDLSQAENDLLEAESNLLGEKYNYVNTLLNLEYTINRDL